MENDFALFRYADVILMYAESLVRQGRAAEAAGLDELAKIRTRAGLVPYSAGQLTLEELYDERGRELAWEGWRRQDMIRFGKFNDPWWAKSLGTKQKDLSHPQRGLGIQPQFSTKPRLLNFYNIFYYAEDHIIFSGCCPGNRLFYQKDTNHGIA